MASDPDRVPFGGSRREGEGPVDLSEAAQLGLAQARNGLDPAERFLDPFADSRAGGAWTGSGSVNVPVSLTEDVREGVVCHPHGWGHKGGWQKANIKGGKNINVLLGTSAGTIERLAGMTLMDGLPVQVAKSRER